ncbi:MAG: STAS domain-containing protein [candidate division Zixibacteria bacterium]|nr:STAS domain-containing protein [candidate division Zixibacteria bacterium]
MEQENEIRVERHGDVTIMDIQGDLTGASEPFVKDAYKQADDEETRKILLKFDENAYFNSDGIKVLLQILGQMKKNNQQVGITGLSKHFRKIFQMVGITKFATICNTEGETLESLAG